MVFFFFFFFSSSGRNVHGDFEMTSLGFLSGGIVKRNHPKLRSKTKGHVPRVTWAHPSIIYLILEEKYTWV